MKKVGRNDPCPCGSGKKFKKCHMGREDELALDSIGEVTQEMSSWITSLPQVNYGRSREMLDAMDIKELTGNAMGIRFVDLKSYSDLNLFGGTHPKVSKGKSGGVFINFHKTQKTDPDNIYLAISSDIDDSSLIHELAHALDYIGGSKFMPGAQEPLSLETGLPLEHLEHPEEYGYWLDYLAKKFSVQLDADDRIISYLYEKGVLLKGEVIKEGNTMILRAKSEQLFRFLSENSKEVDELIRGLDGYIGSREVEE
ncbi:SEC-C domain-containing protein [Deltaproteobacteria bacterium]|nr:SEC-C domain-containing protein [Deltaproteobacteria bacterium]